MITIPASLINKYTTYIEKRGIPSGKHRHFLKWLRFYIDYCQKYRFEQLSTGSLEFFIKKLEEKKQADPLRQQARQAISFYYEMHSLPGISFSAESSVSNDLSISSDTFFHNKERVHDQASFQPDSTALSVNEQINTSLASTSQTPSDWREVFESLENSIKVRHYSPKTLKSYKGWTRKFQAFVKSKDPDSLTVEDVKKFLTNLAVEQGVSASSQNLAFNSLLFLYRNVFHKEFGKVDDVVRAKRKPYIPVVLSRAEIERVFAALSDPHKLIIKLMYGCGLRISECLSLRVQNFNFDMRVLTIHDGKGKKDRTVPIPEALIKELKVQLDRVINLHDQDCQEGYDGVFLYGLLEKKYKNAAREVVWQWFFPAHELTTVLENKERRRYHVHETSLQKALRRAVKKAGIPKRVTSHTFRHSFASHLLQANYDIRTIQELLGHSDIRTTMIYTHTVKSVTIKDAKSPLDF